MTEFEREWIYVEREQHARLLYQLKREIVAKRQAEAASASLQRTDRSPPSALSASLSSAAAPTALARPCPKRPAAPSKQTVSADTL